MARAGGAVEGLSPALSEVIGRGGADKWDTLLDKK